MFLSTQRAAMVFFWLIITMMFCERAISEVYEVGDAAGWTTIGHVDYRAWAASKTFRSGDTIVFKYNKEFHNVKRVSHEDYNACNAAGAYATYTSGNDSFVIKRQRTHLYFLCGFPGHCEAGMKIDIRVHNGSAGAPTPTPAVPSPVPVNPTPPPSSPNVTPSPAASSPPPPMPSPSPAGHKESESAAAASCSGKFWLSIVAVAAYYLTSPIAL